MLINAGEYIYMFTAKHILLDGSNGEIVRQSIEVAIPHDNDNSFLTHNLSLNDNVYLHDNEDAAIVVFKQMDVDIPSVCLADLSFTSRTCLFRGYPRSLGGQDATTLYGNYSEVNKLRTSTPLHTQYDDPLDNCRGFSGSGVFCESDGQLFLMGIVYKLKEEFPQFEILNLACFNELLSKHGLPEVSFQFLAVDKQADAIAKFFRHATEESIRYDSFEIPGPIGQIELGEAEEIEQALVQGINVVLAGEAGTGKSGIANELALSARQQDKWVLLLDARNYDGVRDKADLQQKLNLDSSVANSIAKFSQYTDNIKPLGLRVIIEQFDNVADSQAGKVFANLAIECATLDTVETVVVTRNEGKAGDYVQKLCQQEFKLITCKPLPADAVGTLLRKIDIHDPNQELLSLGSNLLHLSLISQLKDKQPDFDFSTPFTQVGLWKSYIEAFKISETDEEQTSQLIQDAMNVARESLNSSDSRFPIQRTHEYDRLISWQIIIPTKWARKYRFRHQQLQTFLYALDAFERGIMPNEIVEEIDRYSSHDIFLWLEKLHHEENFSRLPNNYYKQLFGATDFRIPFYSQLAVLNVYTESDNPEDNDDVLQIILNQISRQSPDEGLRSHFFKSQPSAAWAVHLLEKGILTTPPEMSSNQNYQSWDAQWYLWRIAAQIPRIVCQHMSAVNADWHYSYIGRAVMILQRIPAEQAAEFAPKILEWLETPSLASYIAKDVCELIEHFAKQESAEAAFQLYEALIEPILHNHIAIPKFGKQHDSVLLDGANTLIIIDCLRVYKILERQLTKALQIEFDKRPVGFSNSSLQRSWRSTIANDEFEENETTHRRRYALGREYKDNLLRLLRDVLKYRVENDRDNVQPELEEYLQRIESRNIFRCVALYILHQYPERFQQLVKQELLDTSRLFEWGLPHDYLLLLPAGFPFLSRTEQVQLLECICEELPKDQATQGYADRLVASGFSLDRDEVVQEQALKRLHLLRDNLEGEWRDYYKTLIAKLDIPTYEDERYTVYPINSEWNEELKRKQLEKMEPDALLEFSRQWTPERKFLMGNPYECLGYHITQTISQDLSHYRSILEQLSLVHFEVAHAIYQHYAPAAKREIDVPWEILTTLSESLLDNDSVCASVDDAHLGISWVSVRRDILRLVRIGLHDALHPALVQLHNRFLNIILKLLDDPDTTTVQPEAMDVLIAFATKTASDSAKGHGPDRLTSTIKEALTRKLTDDDRSISVHAMFGIKLDRLHWLCFDWVREYIDVIFPEGNGDDDREYFITSFGAYITRHRHWGCDEMLKLLYPKYRHAINLYSGISNVDPLNNPFWNLASHVTQEYMVHGYELHPADGESCLMMRFCSEFAPEHLRHISHTMWLWCEDSKSMSTYWPKVKRYWTWRSEVSVSDNYPSEMDEEIQWFVGILTHLPENVGIHSIQELIENAITQLEPKGAAATGWEDLRHYLSREAEHETNIVVKLFKQIEQKTDLGDLFYSHEDTYTILKTGVSDYKSRTLALSIVDSLKRKGYAAEYLDDLYSG